MKRGMARWRWSAFAALLAVFCQAFGVALAMPMPQSGSAPTTLAGYSICHAEGGKHPAGGPAAPSCLACPLCQIIHHGAAPIPSVAIVTHVSHVVATVRHIDPAVAEIPRAVAEAAQPRGPPGGALAL